jgi:hypothetical protein
MVLLTHVTGGGQLSRLPSLALGLLPPSGAAPVHVARQRDSATLCNDNRRKAESRRLWYLLCGSALLQCQSQHRFLRHLLAVRRRAGLHLLFFGCRGCSRIAIERSCSPAVAGCGHKRSGCDDGGRFEGSDGAAAHAASRALLDAASPTQVTPVTTVNLSQTWKVRTSRNCHSSI